MVEWTLEDGRVMVGEVSLTHDDGLRGDSWRSSLQHDAELWIMVSTTIMDSRLVEWEQYTTKKSLFSDRKNRSLKLKFSRYSK